MANCVYYNLTMNVKVLTTYLCMTAVAFAAPTAPSTAHVTFSALYDDHNAALSSVACSNGPNGLMSNGQ